MVNRTIILVAAMLVCPVSYGTVTQQQPLIASDVSPDHQASYYKLIAGLAHFRNLQGKTFKHQVPPDIHHLLTDSSELRDLYSQIVAETKSEAVEYLNAQAAAESDIETVKDEIDKMAYRYEADQPGDEPAKVEKFGSLIDPVELDNIISGFAKNLLLYNGTASRFTASACRQKPPEDQRAAFSCPICLLKSAIPALSTSSAAATVGASIVSGCAYVIPPVLVGGSLVCGFFTAACCLAYPPVVAGSPGAVIYSVPELSNYQKTREVSVTFASNLERRPLMLRPHIPLRFLGKLLGVDSSLTPDPLISQPKEPLAELSTEPVIASDRLLGDILSKYTGAITKKTNLKIPSEFNRLHSAGEKGLENVYTEFVECCRNALKDELANKRVSLSDGGVAHILKEFTEILEEKRESLTDPIRVAEAINDAVTRLDGLSEASTDQPQCAFKTDDFREIKVMTNNLEQTHVTLEPKVALRFVEHLVMLKSGSLVGPFLTTKPLPWWIW